MRRAPPVLVPLLLLAACEGGPKPIADELAGVCDPIGPVVDPGGDLHLVTLDAPGAVCNDGTPATLHLRAATDPAHARDFVIFLHGGNHCTSEQGCTERWCTSRSLMSSERESATVVGGGLLSADPGESPFATWNAVTVNYCSSDMWVGTEGAAELVGPRRSYTVSFRGRDVVEGALDALDRGVVSDDGQVTAEPLASAARIVLAGASAGGHGALQHLDRVAARYPDARVVGSVDSPLFPAPGTMDAAVEEATDLELERFHDLTKRLWGAELDASCEAVESWRCSQVFLLERDHVDTPFLLRHDLYDPTGGAVYIAAGLSESGYADAGMRSARELAEARPDVAVLAPACGDHVVSTSPSFTSQLVTDAVEPDGAWSYATAAAEFEAAGTAVVAIDTPDSAGSVCP